MQKLHALIVFLVSGLLCTGVVYSQMSSPKEQGGGLSWPLTATDYLDMNGNEIRTDGQLTFTDAGATQGFTLQIGADVMELLDQAGTGAADFALQTNGELCFDGATKRNCMYSVGANTTRFESNNVIVTEWGPALVEFRDNTRVAYGSSSDYWHIYTAAAGLELRTTDADGGGTDGTIFQVVDGTDDMIMTGSVTANGGLGNQTGTTLPATCAQGVQFHDTDSNDCADTGGGDGAICICKTANTWALLVDF